MEKSSNKTLTESNQYGSNYNQFVSFSDAKFIKSLGECELVRIDLYADSAYLVGIQTFYNSNDGCFLTDGLRVVGKYAKKIEDGDESIQMFSLGLSEGEYISSYQMRAGDIIDGMSVTTSLSNTIDCGGKGGNHTTVNLEKDKMQKLIGFEGSYLGSGQYHYWNTMHHLKVLSVDI